MEEEVSFVCSKIRKLLKRGVDISHIFLTNVSSDYYYNRCLTIVDLIFKLGEENVNIHNFDSIEVGNEKK